MTLVRVALEWDDRFGQCYDCGLPAAYEAPDMYGARDADPSERQFCSICAAMHAADGERIVWLFAEVYG